MNLIKRPKIDLNSLGEFIRDGEKINLDEALNIWQNVGSSWSKEAAEKISQTKTKNMNIAKALKEKNRIAGRISKLQTMIGKYNRVREDQVVEFDAAELLREMEEEQAHLIEIKRKIARANAGISDKLVEIAETKAQLAFWNEFSNAGAAEEIVEMNKIVDGTYKTVGVKNFSKITLKDVYEKREKLQSKIEQLQDEIDAFNASTLI